LSTAAGDVITERSFSPLAANTLAGTPIATRTTTKIDKKPSNENPMSAEDRGFLIPLTLSMPFLFHPATSI
jgi:hypothetical protein